MENEALVLPELSQGESYHVFCSYSSTDQQWTQSLIQQLEDRGLRVCDHERNFIAGRPILENMSECIGQSQKVLLLLSAEFVRSRWCLLEANMSMFRDCLQRKPIVPVLLQRDVHIPLPLSHITYLDIHNPDFIQQLLRVLWTPNQELQASTVVPYQPPSLYNGKSLQPLPAVNEEKLNRFDCGVWSDEVPDQLSQIIQRRERYREAIGLINTVTLTKARFKPIWTQVLGLLGCVLIVFFYLLGISLFLQLPFWVNAPQGLQVTATVFLYLLTIVIISKLYAVIRIEMKRIVRELQKAIGQANSLLFEEKVLMGSESNSKLLLVYVSVDGCRQELSAESQDDQLFHNIILEYSCSYACLLAKEQLPFQESSDSGHLQGGVCFCQYVINELLLKQNSRVLCCSGQR